MRALRSALPLLLAAAACATPTAQKMSFAEAFPTPPPAAPAEARPLDPRDLNVELMAFSQRARENRAQGERGSAMSAMEVKSWLGMMGRLDSYLARPPQETSPYAVVRARLVLETELELDAHAYGEMPSDMAERALDLINRLASRTAELRRGKVRAQAARVAFAWPVEPVSVTSLFGRRLHPIARVYRQHLGVDLAAGTGQAVAAAADGVVVRAEFNEGHGKHVEVDHGGGVLTRYSHLSAILVEPGLAVKQGDVLGLAGSTGLATGAHLHFEPLAGRSGRRSAG